MSKNLVNSGSVPTGGPPPSAGMRIDVAMHRFACGSGVLIISKRGSVSVCVSVCVCHLTGELELFYYLYVVSTVFC